MKHRKVPIRCRIPYWHFFANIITHLTHGARNEQTVVEISKSIIFMDKIVPYNISSFTSRTDFAAAPYL